MALLWRLEGNSQELVFSVHHVDPRDPIQVRLGDKDLYPPSHSPSSRPQPLSLALCHIEKDLQQE